MKAKVKATGEIIEVVNYDNEQVEVYRNCEKEFLAQNIYNRNEVELLYDKEPAPEKAVIEGYVARDEDGVLLLHCTEPERCFDDDMNIGEWGNAINHKMYLPQKHFPSLTWQSEPKRVKIEITLLDGKEGEK